MKSNFIKRTGTLLFVIVTSILITYGQPKAITINLKDFGAIPNDTISDQAAFEKVSSFINERGGDCILIIPKGNYIVGKQTLRANEHYYYQAGYTLSLNNVKNVTIEGNGAVLKYGVGFRFGSFDPKTGLSTNYTWECKTKPMKGSERAEIGVCIQFYKSKNIQIRNLTLDGNFYPENINNMNDFPVNCVGSNNLYYMPDKINLGGGYGNCGLQVAHYGLFVFHSGNIKIENVVSKRFGTDGILITNTSQNKNVRINNCVFDYNARTGIAIGGGDDIRISNTTISNTARCLYVATATGVDIEPEADALTSDKKATNIVFTRCNFKDNAEGNVLAKYGFESSNVTFNNCNMEGGRAAIILGGKASNYKFLNSKIKGKILYNDKEVNIKDAASLKAMSGKGFQFIGIK